MSSAAPCFLFGGRIPQARNAPSSEQVSDPSLTLPFVKLADNEYEQTAPWVTTTIRFGGFFGCCSTEREISLEELLARKTARARSGRAMNRRAATQQLKELKAQGAPRTPELAALQIMSKMGYKAADRKNFRNLVYIDPRPYSKSYTLWKKSNGKRGWIKPPCCSALIWNCLYLCYYTCCFCEICLSWCFRNCLLCCAKALDCITCNLCGITSCVRVCIGPWCSKVPKQERKLLRVMRFEQRRRDKEVKAFVLMIQEATSQFNLLIAEVQKVLIESPGYKLSIGDCVSLVKQEFVQLCVLQHAPDAGKEVVGQAKMAVGKAVAKDLSKEVAKKLMKDSDRELSPTYRPTTASLLKASRRL